MYRLTYTNKEGNRETTGLMSLNQAKLIKIWLTGRSDYQDININYITDDYGRIHDISI